MNSIDLYEKLIIENNYKSSKILFLVESNNKRFEYINRINLKYSEQLNILTYDSFIKREIKKYWPIITKNCNYIKSKEISPKFISNDFVEFIVNEEVIKKRTNQGYFMDITSSDKNISKNIINNIKKASESLINYKDISDIVYNFKNNKESINKVLFEQMDNIISSYFISLLENSLVDDGISIYLYNNFLLTDDFYIEKLTKEIDFLIVDSLEKVKICEIDFINKISKYCKETFCYFDNTRDYSIFDNIDKDYIKDFIFSVDNINIFFLYNNLDENNTEYIGLNSIKNEIDIKNFFEDIKFENIYLLNKKLYLDEESKIYCEMIERSCNKIKSLISKGVSKKDIAIIAPLNDNILENSIKNILKDIDIFNLKNTNKMTDYSYISVLYVAICIFYDLENFINYDEYINFIEVIFSTNKINARKILNNKEKCLVELIEFIKSSKLELNEFIMDFYLNKIINLKYRKENIKHCKYIVDECEKFINNIQKVSSDKSISKGELLVNYIKNYLSSFSNYQELNNINDKDLLLICSPIQYLSYNLNKKYIILLDVSSEIYNIKIEKEISNILAFRKTFEGKVYNESMDSYYKEYYLRNIIYSIFKTCEKIYAYKSDYSIGGFIQDNSFYTMLLKLKELE